MTIQWFKSSHCADVSRLRHAPCLWTRSILRRACSSPACTPIRPSDRTAVIPRTLLRDPQSLRHAGITRPTTMLRMIIPVDAKCELTRMAGDAHHCSPEIQRWVSPQSCRLCHHITQLDLRWNHYFGPFALRDSAVLLISSVVTT